MNKKTLILVAVVIIILILTGLSMYFFLSKKTPSTPGGTFPGPGQPTTVTPGGGRRRGLQYSFYAWVRGSITSLV